MATEKIVSYSAEQTAALVTGYLAGVAVETLAADLGKSVRSVIAKLSREGVYKAKAKAKGEASLTKAEIVEKIAAKAGVPAVTLASLEKASKEALEIVAALGYAD
jgi:hypothetical protein